MAALLRKINTDLKEALKAHQAAKVSALRFILSQIHNREIEKRGGERPELSDEEILDVLAKEVKKRKEALDIFRKSDRSDLVGKEEGELVFLESYLPRALDDEEIEAVVDKIIKTGKGDFSQVMKEAMAELKGRADGGLVSRMVKQKLARKN